MMLSRQARIAAYPVRRQMMKAASTSAAARASTLVVAEHDGSALNAATLHAVSAAQQVGGDVSVLVLGGAGSEAVAAEAASIDGVAKVLHGSDDAYAHNVAENIANGVAAAADGFSHIMVGATAAGKNWMPRVAAALDTNPVVDILSVESEDTFTRPMYAGNAIATVKSHDDVKVISVRTTAFEKAAVGGGSAAVEAASAPDAGADAGKSQWVSDEIAKSDRPELTSAPIVVAGGRGLKAKENFALLDSLADKMGAAVGASRAAVDANYVPNDYQIGQTGKVVAPDLYIAVGISGAIQHLAGMKDSKTIVAINKDPEAPIFQVSDYGLVDDLFNAVPDLTEKV